MQSDKHVGRFEDEPAAPRQLRTIVLTNTRQSPRFALHVPDGAPDPTLEYTYLRQNGVEQHLRDRNEFPLNPMARMHLLYAGIDIARAFRVLLFDRRVDAVLCVFENTALAILLFRRIFHFKVPVFLLEVSGRGWRPRDIILDFVMPRVDQVLTLTTASKIYVETTYKLRRPAIVVGYSIDETFFRPNVILSGDACLKEEYILTVGKDETRDFELLLKACEPLSFPVIIRTDLPIILSEHPTGPVKVINNWLSYRELRDLYKKARLVALPLRPADNPGGITTLFEAMAMAKPIVCSDTGATRDIIVEGKNGLLVPPGDAEAMRAAISWLLSHPNEAADLGRSARAYIEQEFSERRRAERMASAMKNSLHELRVARA